MTTVIMTVVLLITLAVSVRAVPLMRWPGRTDREDAEEPVLESEVR